MDVFMHMYELVFGHPPSPQACENPCMLARAHTHTYIHTQVAAIRLVMSLTSHSEAMDRKLAETVSCSRCRMCQACMCQAGHAARASQHGKMYI